MSQRSQRHKQEVHAVYPPPAISTLTPSTAANSTSTPLSIAGTNFRSGDVITFAGTDYAATYVSPTQLTATASIPVGAAGTKQVSVKRSTTVSNQLPFTVT